MFNKFKSSIFQLTYFSFKKKYSKKNEKSASLILKNFNLDNFIIGNFRIYLKYN